MNALSAKDRFPPGGRRIMALWFPYLPTERILRARLGRSWRSAAALDRQKPLVVARKDNNAWRIAALDEKAETLALRRGMGVADARAMHPGIEVVEADAAADRRLLEATAEWCDRYTPLVALDDEDGLFLDVTGSQHLFGGEPAMAEDVAARFGAQGFDVRAGLASTPGMAWAAARFLGPVPVPPGGESEALSPLPLAALRLEPALRIRLEGVGLREVGALAAAPRAPLARRFGAALLTRLDQALGRLEEPVSPRLPVPSLAVERHLAEPVVLMDEVERLVLALSATLKGDLERRGEGARTLQLSLFRVDGAVRRLGVGASRPLRDPALIGRLFREKLATADIDAGFGFELVRLAALATAPFDAGQIDLAGHGRNDAAGLALFTDRVRARLGEGAIAVPRPIESHLPERAVTLLPFAAAVAQRPAKASGWGIAERPIRLFSRPEPIEVAAAQVPEGPPQRFRWRRAIHLVAHAEGPERIAPEWWRDGEDAPARDYFRVEDEDGRRYWLFRQGLYGQAAAMPRWFLHGLFA